MPADEVPYSNRHELIAAPFGVAVPVNVSELAPVATAPSVSAEGGSAGVVKLSSPLSLPPLALLATIRK